jgi:hypothetical protein
MVRILRLLVWTTALVAFWVSAEQGAFTTPPRPDDNGTAAATRSAVPIGSWEKLKSLFLPAEAETPPAGAREGRP